MGQYIIKPRNDEDLYGYWSTVVDNLTWTGTLQDLRDCRNFGIVDFGSEPLEPLLQRVELYGSSSYMGDFRWVDTNDIAIVGNMQTFEGQRVLSYRNLAEYVRLWDADDYAAAEALTEPITEE